MNESEISRRCLLGRLFGGFAFAVGAMAAGAQAAPIRPTSPPAAGTSRCAFDEQGRLLFTYDSLVRKIAWTAPASKRA